jgi:hypothetical protein
MVAVGALFRGPIDGERAHFRVADSLCVRCAVSTFAGEGTVAGAGEGSTSTPSGVKGICGVGERAGG